ncbi:helix-turn-helix domain-containing protein, partial [Streptomyces viridochromogenes]|uniref:helix-turn-helix domain-containing protein n=2 Tax=Streptomyces TaxID=1883 RepID=UPI001180CE74
MTGFDAIDALLAGARKEVPLPPVPERRTLREELGLSRPQLAQALGVGPSTIAGWESGRDPSGEVREKYAYFLEGARTKLSADSTPQVTEPTPQAADPTPPAADLTPSA